MELESLYYPLAILIAALAALYFLYLIWSNMQLARLKEELKAEEKKINDIKAEYEKKKAEFGTKKR